MGLYNALDIISTITEKHLWLYVMIVCFCNQVRFHPSVSRLELWNTTALLTYLTDLGGLKLFILYPFAIVIAKICYRSPLRYCMVTVEVSFILGSTLSEAVGISLMSWIYHGDTTNQMGGKILLKWQIYVVVLLLRCVFLAIAYGYLNLRMENRLILDLTFAVLCIFLVLFLYSKEVRERKLPGRWLRNFDRRL